MIRPLSFSLAAGTALLAASLSSVAESFPVVHNEPITVRILGGKNGLPFAHLHLVMLGGYDRSDLHDQFYRAEALTDARGQARLPKQLANLPWLQVWVTKKPLCQAKPRRDSFSVALIRRDGLSTPNRCGTATVEDAPGVFTVFVKGKGKSTLGKSLLKHAKAQPQASSAPVITQPAVEAQAPKPVQAQITPPAMAAPAPKPAEAPASPAATPPPAAAVSPTLPAPAPTPAPVVMAQPASPPAGTSAPVLAAVAARDPASSMDKTVAHRTDSPVARRPVSYRPRPNLASCQVQSPAAKAARARASTIRKSPPTTVKPLVATHKPKPPAGVRMVTVTPGKPITPPTQN